MSVAWSERMPLHASSTPRVPRVSVIRFPFRTAGDSQTNATLPVSSRRH